MDSPTSPQYGSSTSSSGGAPAPGANGDSITGALDRGRTKIAESATAAGDDLAGDMKNLRADLAKVQETLVKFASEVGSHSSRTMGDVSQAVAGQVGSAASGIADASAEIAASATAQAKTFASELEIMARRNPLGTLAGTLAVGMVLGFISRGGRN
jgi:ElaB/YqjD/DUF883 family membrane-anchored ribosome-binding protein